MILKLLLSFVQIATAIAVPSLPPLLQQLQGVLQQEQFMQQMPILGDEHMQSMHQPLQTVNQQWLHLHQISENIDKQMQQIPKLQTLQSVQHPIPSLQIRGTMQQQMLALQEQIFALQKFQALQKMGLIPSPTAMKTRPILLLFPDTVPSNDQDVRRTDFDTNNLKSQKPEVSDDDSVVIEAESPGHTNIKRHPMRAVLLMPNTRGFIGDFISSIPFLPFEINVPDTISWIYNGIAGIISGIGQTLPFRPNMPNTDTQNEGNVKSIWKQTDNLMPIVVIPLDQIPMFAQG